MEIELKLLCDAAALQKLAGHPLLQQLAESASEHFQLLSTYFDTPDFFLRQHGLGLRVRRVGKRCVQTLKGGGGEAAGLHKREEWESPVAGKRPDLGTLRTMVGEDSRLSELLADNQLEDRLRPVFTTEFKRIAWSVRLPDGQRIECALDLGKLKCGAKTELISEMELELKAGDAGGLFELAQQLMADVSFRLGHASKAARGYAMCELASAPSVVNAGRFRLSPKTSVASAGRKVFANCLAHIFGNEAGVIDGRELESVHQMRVGLRRLRSAIDLFGDSAHCPKPLLAELRWITAELGTVRDWEVFASETLGELIAECSAVENGFLRSEDLVAIKNAAEVIAVELRRKAADTVQSERYARLALALGAWQHRGKRLPSDSSKSEILRLEMESPLGNWAKRRLDVLLLKLLKRGKHLSKATAAQRHRVRISAKKLRYAVEFFLSLYSRKQASGFVARLKQLQEALGRLNDAFVADAHLRLLADRNPQLAACAHFLRGWFVERSQGRVCALGSVWKRFRLATVPWE